VRAEAFAAGTLDFRHSCEWRFQIGRHAGVPERALHESRHVRDELTRLVPFVLLAALSGCGASAPPAPLLKTEVPKPPDESRYLPQTNLVDSKVVDDHLLGKSFMPGGTVGHYKKGKVEYEIFIRKMENPVEPAVLLPDWNKALTGAKLIAHFGAYFGYDNGRPVFVFAKGSWIAGIAGLPEKDADLEARTLAGKLQ